MERFDVGSNGPHGMRVWGNQPNFRGLRMLYSASWARGLSLLLLRVTVAREGQLITPQIASDCSGGCFVHLQSWSVTEAENISRSLETLSLLRLSGAPSTRGILHPSRKAALPFGVDVQVDVQCFWYTQTASYHVGMIINLRCRVRERQQQAVRGTADNVDTVV